jgi:hypothetical protein
VKRVGRRLVALAAVTVLVLAGCGDDGESTDAEGATLHVPADHPTIQAAVDAASPGDLILVEPGVYEEAVEVQTDRLTIRGLDRNEVILDGGFELENGVRILDADGVAVENMTARNFTGNGFFWTEVDGYRGSYLTAYRNGDYGIYAYDSTHGLLEHSYASGSPDAGFYIGECYPCDAVIDDVISEYNGLGYSGTNAGGNLLIVNSTFRFNRAGVAPNSGSYELCYPQRASTIVGNLVHSNNQPDTPAIDVALLAMGNGILVGGGRDNVIERNRVFDHAKTGIGLVPFLEEEPIDDIPTGDELTLSCEEASALPVEPPGEPLLWQPMGNSVRENVVEGSGLADLAVASVGTDLSTLGNCFEANTFASTAPTDLEALAPCTGDGSGGSFDVGALDVASWLTEEHPPSADYQTTPEPADQPTMPDPETSPAAPATAMPPAVDLAAIEVPDDPR